MQILIILTSISLSMIAFGLIFRDTLRGVFLGIGIVSLIIIGLFGFLLYGMSSGDTLTVEQVQINTVLKSDTKVYVELENGLTLEYVSKKDYDGIDEYTPFYKITYYNIYGYVVRKSFCKNPDYKELVNKGRVKNN